MASERETRAHINQRVEEGKCEQPQEWECEPKQGKLNGGWKE